PQPRSVVNVRKQRGLIDDGRDDPRNQVPVLGQMDGDHRLDVKNIDHLVLTARSEVEVILERDANEVSYRVLRLLGEFRLALFRCRLPSLKRAGHPTSATSYG